MRSAYLSSVCFSVLSSLAIGCGGSAATETAGGAAGGRGGGTPAVPVTVAVPTEIYRRARVKAAERDTSLSALVREFLISVADEGSDFARRKRLQDEVLRSIRHFRAANQLRRDALHERPRKRARAVR